MADNISIRDATGTSRTVACDEVTIDGALAEVQRVKVVHGAAGSAVDASPANPFPVDATTADGVLAGQGRKTSTSPGTAVALGTSQASKWVVVSAFATNTDRVHIGGSAVIAAAGSQTGIGLAPGQSCVVPTANVSAVFVDVRVSGEGVAYAYGA